MRERPLALGQERIGEIIEGAPIAVAPVAFTPWLVVVRAPGPDVVAVTPGTLERMTYPSWRINIRLTLMGVEELV